MTPSLFNSGLSNDLTECDSIIVELPIHTRTCVARVQCFSQSSQLIFDQGIHWIEHKSANRCYTLFARSLISKTYESAHEFLASLPDGLPECLIVDLQMPEMTGLELHHQLTRSGIYIPTIIITAHTDIRVRERSEAARM